MRSTYNQGAANHFPNRQESIGAWDSNSIEIKVHLRCTFGVVRWMDDVSCCIKIHYKFMKWCLWAFSQFHQTHFDSTGFLGTTEAHSFTLIAHTYTLFDFTNRNMIDVGQIPFASRERSSTCFSCLFCIYRSKKEVAYITWS